MATIRSPLCGYNMTQCVELMGEDLWRYLNKTQSVGLQKNVRAITRLPTERISARSQWQTFLRVLPTRWRPKPAGVEITSLPPYVYGTHISSSFGAVVVCLSLDDDRRLRVLVHVRRQSLQQAHIVRVNNGSQAVTHDPLTHTKTDP